ncbi:DUF4329 domain-containing protein [Porticoccus sp. W117]|uniref:DUF4329 domain-containing protein n=1 Tax=Porticoccus sp. W117 TaxID=3054777 RepID=UPI0025996FB4|nr:DUF4329 domain-containing protein [Porticoccus sp. W117]MDM3870765.1 DUF4329 domain-containing protein [Porticoccus sp. W117]
MTTLKNNHSKNRFLKITGLLGLASALVAFASVSFADETRLVQQPYATEVAAVTAAANRFNPDSIRKDREYMGTVLEKDGLYYYTYTVGHRGHDEITTMLPDSEFGKAVALWQTHGRVSHKNRFFSPSDTDVAKRLELPFYLADHTGELKVYNPGDDTLPLLTAQRKGFYVRGASEGSLVKDELGNVVAIATKASEQNSVEDGKRVAELH